MSKFKVGDKVKILSTSAVEGISNHGVEVGMVGEVVGVSERGANVKNSNFKWSCWSFNDCYLELVDDVSSDTNTTNETEPKFKVGDVVKVTSTDYISQFDKSIKVGDIGTITSVSNSYDKTDYCVNLNETSGKIYWWFSESDLELVEG